MAKEHTVESAVKSLKKVYGVEVKNNTIHIHAGATLGNKSWGKIDFLKKNGYDVIRTKDAVKKEKSVEKTDEDYQKPTKKVEVDLMSKMRINYKH